MLLTLATTLGYDTTKWGADFKKVWEAATNDGKDYNIVSVGTFVTPDMECFCKDQETWAPLAAAGYTSTVVASNLCPVRQPKALAKKQEPEQPQPKGLDLPALEATLRNALLEATVGLKTQIQEVAVTAVPHAAIEPAKAPLTFAAGVTVGLGTLLAVKILGGVKNALQSGTERQKIIRTESKGAIPASTGQRIRERLQQKEREKVKAKEPAQAARSSKLN